jgi:hypothetical protein
LAIYTEYGLTMFEAQQLELVVRQLFQLRQLEAADPDSEGAETVGVDEELRQLFSRPLGKLAKKLGVDDTLAGEIKAAVQTRNVLAHSFLLTSQILVHQQARTPGEAIDELRGHRERFEQLREQVDAVIAVALDALDLNAEVDEADITELEQSWKLMGW